MDATAVSQELEGPPSILDYATGILLRVVMSTGSTLMSILVLVSVMAVSALTFMYFLYRDDPNEPKSAEKAVDRPTRAAVDPHTARVAEVQTEDPNSVSAEGAGTVIQSDDQETSSDDMESIPEFHGSCSMGLDDEMLCDISPPWTLLELPDIEYDIVAADVTKPKATTTTGGERSPRQRASRIPRRSPVMSRKASKSPARTPGPGSPSPPRITTAGSTFSMRPGLLSTVQKVGNMAEFGNSLGTDELRRPRGPHWQSRSKSPSRLDRMLHGYYNPYHTHISSLRASQGGIKGHSCIVSQQRMTRSFHEDYSELIPRRLSPVKQVDYYKRSSLSPNFHGEKSLPGPLSSSRK